MGSRPWTRPRGGRPSRGPGASGSAGIKTHFPSASLSSGRGVSGHMSWGVILKLFPPSLGLTLFSSSMTNGETVGEEHPEHEKDEGRRKHDRPVVAQIYIHLIICIWKLDIRTYCPPRCGTPRLAGRQPLRRIWPNRAALLITALFTLDNAIEINALKGPVPRILATFSSSRLSDLMALSTALTAYVADR